MISPSDVWRGERRRNRVQSDVYVVERMDGKRAPYPYHLRDLLLTVEIVSPSNPLLDCRINRDLYLREGVGGNTGSRREVADRREATTDATYRAGSTPSKYSTISCATRPMRSSASAYGPRMPLRKNATTIGPLRA